MFERSRVNDRNDSTMACGDYVKNKHDMFRLPVFIRRFVGYVIYQ